MENSYTGHLKGTLDLVRETDVLEVIEQIKICTGRIFVFGNGGSSATASHFAQDMNKNTMCRVVCLNDNMPSVLAYGNDVGFSFIFKLQLKKFVKAEDLVIGISCSGTSPNVVHALEYAKEYGCTTVGITGFDGGKLRDLTDFGIYVPSNDMQVCEDIHLILTHVIMRALL